MPGVGACARPRCSPDAPPAAARTTGRYLPAGTPAPWAATHNAVSGVPSSPASDRALPRGRDDDHPHGAIRTRVSRAPAAGAWITHTRGLFTMLIYTLFVFMRGPEPEEERTHDA